MSKVMDIYVKFTKTTHKIWSCHVTLASNSENFYFSPNSVSNFRKSYQIWGKLALEQKSYRQKQTGGWKTPPSAYRVKLSMKTVQVYLIIGTTLEHSTSKLFSNLKVS